MHDAQQWLHCNKYISGFGITNGKVNWLTQEQICTDILDQRRNFWCCKHYPKDMIHYSFQILLYHMVLWVGSIVWQYLQLSQLVEKWQVDLYNIATGEYYLSPLQVTNWDISNHPSTLTYGPKIHCGIFGLWK